MGAVESFECCGGNRQLRSAPSAPVLDVPSLDDEVAQGKSRHVDVKSRAKAFENGSSHQQSSESVVKPKAKVGSMKQLFEGGMSNGHTKPQPKKTVPDVKKGQLLQATQSLMTKATPVVHRSKTPDEVRRMSIENRGELSSMVNKVLSSTLPDVVPPGKRGQGAPAPAPAKPVIEKREVSSLQLHEQKLKQQAAQQAVHRSSVVLGNGATPKCAHCGKSAYHNESINYDNQTWHKRCFKCKSCGNKVASLSDVAMIKGDLYHKTCFKRIFLTKGDYKDFNDESLTTAKTAPAPAAKAEIESSSSQLSLADRMNVFAEKSTEEELQEERKRIDDRQQRHLRRRDSRSSITMEAKEAVQLVLEEKFTEHMELEEKLGNIEEALEKLPDDTQEVNFNNTQEFLKATKEQRTEKYQNMIEFLRQRNSDPDPAKHIPSFTCTAADLDNEFGVLFGAYMAEDTSLVEVNLENNNIGDTGIIAIAEGLKKNKSIRTLKLIHNVTSTKAEAALAHAVDVTNPERNRTLTKITFHFNLVQNKDKMNKGLEYNFAVMKGWKR